MGRRPLVPEKYAEELRLKASGNGHPPAKPESLQGRVPLAKLIRDGIELTPQILEGLLYEGKIHSMASEPGTGKTLLALWMAIQIMRAGGRVLYLDAENGPKLIAEPLEELGADLTTLDDRFFYYPAETNLETECLRQLAATVADVGPALAVFDSLADFLALSGLEENSNSDCTRWVAGVVQPLKEAGVASLILDHVPKGAKGPRGASSKLAKVDVQWNLEVTLDFGRERTGEIELKHSKDRECWLPKIARFSVGAGVFARSAGTIEAPDSKTGMTDNASKVFDRMRKAGEEGARWTELLATLNGSKGALQRALRELGRWDLFEKRYQKYYVKEVAPQNPVDKPDPQGTMKYHQGTPVPPGADESGRGTTGTTPPRGCGTRVPDVPKSLGEDDFG